jgi:hypothetical protein
MNSRLEQLLALTFDPDADVAECAQADLFHEFSFPITMPPSFETMPTRQPPIGPGTYIVKVIKAREKLSEKGNDVILMTLALPDSRTLSAAITFTDSTRAVLNAFVASCGLTVPAEPGIRVELPANILVGRYCYITVATESDDQGGVYSKFVRYLTRAEALAVNPELAKITLREQAPIHLAPAINKPDLFGS